MSPNHPGLHRPRSPRAKPRPRDSAREVRSPLVSSSLLPLVSSPSWVGDFDVAWEKTGGARARDQAGSPWGGVPNATTPCRSARLLSISPPCQAKLWGDPSLLMPRRRPREVLLSLCPGVPRGQPPRRPGIDVALPEVDASVPPGDACLRRGVGEGSPGERDVVGRGQPRLDPGTTCGESHRGAERVHTGEQPQDLGTRCAEVAVP